MANLGETLYTHLVGWPALNALVGNRIYPTRMPQDPTLPAIVWHRIARRPVHVKVGYVRPIAGVLLQFDVMAATYAEIDAIAIELKQALYGFRVVEPYIYDVMVQGEVDGDEIDLVQFHRSIDAEIWYSEE
jgi:hypothetical protein